MFSDGEAFYIQKGGSLRWTPADDQESDAGQYCKFCFANMHFSATQKKERRRPILSLFFCSIKA
jgi:hypothetical protein